MGEQRRYRRPWLWILGWKIVSGEPEDGPKLQQVKSNLRRFFSRITFTVVCLFWVWAFYLQDVAEINFVQAIGFLVYGVGFFSYVVLRTPFRSGLKVNAARLLADTILSSAYFICAFSLIYSLLGTSRLHADILDNLYFSTVTFSTLGYGDIQPNRESQLYAGLEAIIGNLHLGMIVGATFAAITNTKK